MGSILPPDEEVGSRGAGEQGGGGAGGRGSRGAGEQGGGGEDFSLYCFKIQHFTYSKHVISSSANYLRSSRFAW
ncbi:hypothetical protein JYQ62_08935 [Nostoc sp. UHCC 0702]|nr:hypothetical protein JYQ62_08935 [Nostoc sp. UHCC 0702]